MVMFLPKKLDGLPELEKSLSLARLASLLLKLHIREVITYLPKFKMEASFGLKPTLEVLGMKRAFSREANFSGASAPRRTYTSPP